MDDLFQIGCIGLIKAIDNFDLSHGVRFSTYAVPMIEGEIKRYIRDNNSLRISRSIKDIAYKINKYREEFLKENEREPTPMELSIHFEVPEYEIAYAINSGKTPMSMNEPIYDDGGDPIFLEDQIADPKGINTEWGDIIELNKSMLLLDERERKVVNDRYILGRTQSDIAEILNISQAQVSRIENSAIRKLKKLIN